MRICSLPSWLQARGPTFPTYLCPYHQCPQHHVLKCYSLQKTTWGPLGEQGRMCNLYYGLPLYIFEGISGFSINHSKTCLPSTRTDQRPDLTSVQKLNCSTSVLPIAFLRVPISGRRPKRQDWESQILKIRTHLSSQKSRFLSQGGSSYASQFDSVELPTQWMSIYKLPYQVIKEIDPIRMDFLQSKTNINHPSYHLVN